MTLGEIAILVGGELVGPADLAIDAPVPTTSTNPNGITFAENAEYLAEAEASGVGAILVPPNATPEKPHIKVAVPRQAFGALLYAFNRPMPLEATIHSTAVVSIEAIVDPSASIGPYCVVERGAVVGPRAQIFPFCYIGENCTVGEATILYPHVVLYQDVRVGKMSVIHSGAVLGADGFGFGWDGQTRLKVPQIGGIDIGDDVEIGANTTVDRATAGTTRIGDGTKIDNLVQVAHNAEIGTHSVIAGQTGIAGSTKIGNRVVMGGNVGTKDHVKIGDDVTLGGRSGVSEDLLVPGEYFGTPAMPKREAIRVFLLQAKLPDLFSRLKALEKRLNELEKG